MIDVGKFVGGARLGRYHVAICLLCAMVLVTGGFSLTSMGMVVPTLSDEWGLDQAAFSRDIISPLSAVMYGVVGGSVAAGYLADRYGRRLVLMAMMLLASIGMAATATADGFGALILFRVITGVGAGGAIPIAIAAVSDIVPDRKRNLLIMTMYVGAPLGTSLGGISGPAIITQFGWEGLFLFGSLALLLVTAGVVALLPESFRFLAARAGGDHCIGAILSRIRPAAGTVSATRFILADTDKAKVSAAALFRNGRARITFTLWLIFVGMQYVMFFVSLMMPAYLKSNGWAATDALLPLGVYNLGAIFGSIALGLLANRIGAARSLLISLPLATLLLCLLALVVSPTRAFLALAFVAGAMTTGSGMALAPLAAGLYPAAVRSTGVGFALGIGRLGSIAAPLIGAVGLSHHIGARGFFLAAAAGPLLCLLGVILLLSFLRRRSVTAHS